VLVVDDEPSVRALMAEVLTDQGYCVLEADTGAVALQILQTRQTIDLLVSDVGLPGGMNGRQLADAARSLRPDLKVLFVTGYAENAALGNGRLAPGMHVLTKPFSIPALSERVKGLLEG
jgi:CheY-like chemotaxis protein